MCRQLSTVAIPETVQHDDLHDGQVFVRDGRYLFFDWGDSCVSHPFFSMSVTLEGGLAWGLDDIEGSVDITPFRDAYLRPFASFAGREELEAAHTTALRLGWVCRALNVSHWAVGTRPTASGGMGRPRAPPSTDVSRVERCSCGRGRAADERALDEPLPHRRLPRAARRGTPCPAVGFGVIVETPKLDATGDATPLTPHRVELHQVDSVSRSPAHSSCRGMVSLPLPRPRHQQFLARQPPETQYAPRAARSRQLSRTST